jgi:carbamoyl-phosphate synthase large subunit
MAKALLAASLRPPLPDADGRLALLSIADRDKDRLAPLAAALAEAGYRLAATRGTARALRRLGHEPLEVARLGDEPGARPTILDTIRSGTVRFVVNTPSPQAGPVRDAVAIRRTALEEGVLCLTSIDTAIAAARSLHPDLRSGMSEVRALGEWLVRAQVPGRTAGASGLSLPA